MVFIVGWNALIVLCNLILSHKSDTITLEKILISHGVSQDQVNLKRYYDNDIKTMVEKNMHEYDRIKILFQDALSVSFDTWNNLTLINLQVQEIIPKNTTTVSTITLEDSTADSNRTIEEWYTILDNFLNNLGLAETPTIFFTEIITNSLVVVSHGKCYKYNATRCECFQYVFPNSSCPTIPPPTYSTESTSTPVSSTETTVNNNATTTPSNNRTTSSSNNRTTSSSNNRTTSSSNNKTTSSPNNQTTSNSTWYLDKFEWNHSQKDENEETIMIAIIFGCVLFVAIVLYIAFLLVKRANKRTIVYPVQPLHRPIQEAKPHLVISPASNEPGDIEKDKPLSTFQPFPGNFSVFPGSKNSSIIGSSNSILGGGVNGLSRDSNVNNPVYLDEHDNEKQEPDYLNPVVSDSIRMVDETVKPTFLDVFDTETSQNDASDLTNFPGIIYQWFEESPDLVYKTPKDDEIVTEDANEQQEEYAFMNFYDEDLTDEENIQEIQQECEIISDEPSVITENKDSERHSQEPPINPENNTEVKDNEPEPLYSAVKKARKIFAGNQPVNNEDLTKEKKEKPELTGIERRHSSVRDLVNSFNQNKELKQDQPDDDETFKRILEQETATETATENPPTEPIQSEQPDNWNNPDYSLGAEDDIPPPPMPRQVTLKKEFPIERVNAIPAKRSPPSEAKKRPSFKYV